MVSVTSMGRYACGKVSSVVHYFPLSCGVISPRRIRREERTLTIQMHPARSGGSRVLAVGGIRVLSDRHSHG